MTADIRALRRYDLASARVLDRAVDDPLRPPAEVDVGLLGMGNSGEALALRCQGLALNDGLYVTAAGLNNDRLAPRAIPVRRQDGSVAPLELSERLVMDGDSPRDQLRDHPLLEQRYARLLKGVSVLETYPHAGAGGHGLPVVSALDIDLRIDEVLQLQRRFARRLYGEPQSTPGMSDVQRLLAQTQHRQEPSREKLFVLIGGGGGAMGNAAHHLIPYLLRAVLAEQGVRRYQIWGVVLGPRSYAGLTPFVRHNYRALLESIEHLSRHGQRRTYINDLTIDIRQPPYDRLFLLDDPALPGEGARVTEREIEIFLDRAALSLHLLLRGTAWETVASHIANDDGFVRADGRLRYLNTVNGAAIGADRAQIADLLEADLSARVLDQLVRRFNG